MAALKLELKNYIGHLTFMTEYELTGRPKYVTLTFVRAAKPVKLLKDMKEQNCAIVVATLSA